MWREADSQAGTEVLGCPTHPPLAPLASGDEGQRWDPSPPGHASCKPRLAPTSGPATGPGHRGGEAPATAGFEDTYLLPGLGIRLALQRCRPQLALPGLPCPPPRPLAALPLPGLLRPPRSGARARSRSGGLPEPAPAPSPPAVRARAPGGCGAAARLSRKQQSRRVRLAAAAGQGAGAGQPPGPNAARRRRGVGEGVARPSRGAGWGRVCMCGGEEGVAKGRSELEAGGAPRGSNKCAGRQGPAWGISYDQAETSFGFGAALCSFPSSLPVFRYIRTWHSVRERMAGITLYVLRPPRGKPPLSGQGRNRIRNPWPSMCCLGIEIPSRSLIW